MKKALLVVLCCSMAIMAPLKAQFGCFNCATEWTQLLNHFELVQQLSSMIKSYQQLVETYTLAKEQAKHVLNAGNYRGLWKTWLQAGAPDAYGHNIGFVSNINGQLGMLGASLRTLPSLDDGMFSKLHADTSDRIQWQYSEAQLEEGIGAYAMDTVGEVHQNDQKGNLDNLDGLVFSDDDLSNTAVQEAQKTSMAVTIAAHQNEDMKRLLTAIVSQQTMEMKTRHDALEQVITGQKQWLVRAQAGEVESYLGNPSGRISTFAY